MCLATTAYVYTAAQYVLLFLVPAVNSNWFQILQLHALTQAVHSYALLPAMDLPHFFPQYPPWFLRLYSAHSVVKICLAGHIRSPATSVYLPHTKNVYTSLIPKLRACGMASGNEAYRLSMNIINILTPHTLTHHTPSHTTPTHTHI